MRGLTETFLNDLKQGKLKDVLVAVKSDDTLCLEIRDNYINIYYRGGCILKISSTAVDYKMEFDRNYYHRYTGEITAIVASDVNKWLEFIPFLKAEMDHFFNVHPKLEREYQQLVLRENNNSSISNDTDYYIVDLEYANIENGSRFDLLAVKWDSTSGSHKTAEDVRLVFIEKKYGDGALNGSAGISKHFEDLFRFLSDQSKVADLYQEVETILNQKIELELIQGIKKTIKISRGKPEFLILMANHKPVKSAFKRELKIAMEMPYHSALKALVDIKIPQASFMGYGLYKDRMINLEEFVNEY
ncbi:MAG: hypothetical protein JJE17_08450 [Peptostreptococcaceae bacterium]|nr:hypothetical protein [Peptostreptococcaceae bacterium]